MTVRNALLALLEQGPMYGYQLRAEFERRTGATWPLNVGQVYTTLSRLERDGFVEGTGGRRRRGHVIVRRDGGRARGGRGVVHHAVARTQPPRDELAIKLALAVTVPGVDVGTVIQQQRSATMGALQDYTRIKRAGGPASGPRLEPGARQPGVQRRGRDPLARPLRGPRTACGRGPRRGSGRRGQPRPRRRSDERGPPPRPGHPHPRRGRDRGARPQGRQLPGERRRAGRRDGPVGVRQVDPADPGRRPRLADERVGARRGHRPRDPGQQRPRADAAYLDRLRLPGLQPDPGAHRRGERRPARASSTASARPSPGRPPSRRSRRWASRTSPSASPTRCRAASSSGSPSPGRSSASGA